VTVSIAEENRSDLHGARVGRNACVTGKASRPMRLCSGRARFSRAEERGAPPPILRDRREDQPRAVRRPLGPAGRVIREPDSTRTVRHDGEHMAIVASLRIHDVGDPTIRWESAALSGDRRRRLARRTHRSEGPRFDPGEAIGSGLANMRDRLEALGGAVAIRSAKGEGTAVRGRVPVGAV
jgi:hypothetical protein